MCKKKNEIWFQKSMGLLNPFNHLTSCITDGNDEQLYLVYMMERFLCITENLVAVRENNISEFQVNRTGQFKNWGVRYCGHETNQIHYQVYARKGESCWHSAETV